MIITLNDTTSAKISAELLQARRSAGSPAQGMVLTLIIVCDESEYTSAMEASVAAGREHPSRILLVVTAAGRTASLDAEVHIGDATPGDVVVIRMRGAVAAHPASVIRPLLLPDSPVVARQGTPQADRRRIGTAGHAPPDRRCGLGPTASGTEGTCRGLHAWRH